MKTLHVNLSEGRSYDIHIERGLLKKAGQMIRSIYAGSRIAIITDSNVEKLYAQTLEDALHAAGFVTKRIVFPAGEKSKNLAGLELLYDGLLSTDGFTLTRTDLVVALGGGVTGDMGGFAAGSVLRGVPYIQIPTTLLSQVDSSVGGKVAIDLKQGKNLAGLFYQPKMVLIDSDTLDTLPDRVFFDGMGEVIKYGMIREPALWRLLEQVKGRKALAPYMDEIIYTCCNCKRKIVELDEHDTGERMLLNFGHTIGHAYEKLGNYEKYMHGEAVCCGMYSILRIGEQHGLTAPGLANRMRRMLEGQGMLWDAGQVSEKALTEALAFDKKGSGGTIRPVFCREVGDSYYTPVDRAEFVRWVLARDEVPEMAADGTDSLPVPKQNRAVFPSSLSGELTIPSSKSMSHRMVIAASLAGDAVSEIGNLSGSEDISATLQAVAALGADYRQIGPETVEITGITGTAKEGLLIDCGESGSTLRFMIPVALALTGGKPVSFTGRGRLMQRPLEPYYELFDRMGIAHRLENGVLTVEGELLPGEYPLSGLVSSQFITGLLFALPLLRPQVGATESVIAITDRLESAAYVDMTMQTLKIFGIDIQMTEDYLRFIVPAGQKYHPQKVLVEGDYSQAAFYLAYNTICRLQGKTGRVTPQGLRTDSLQGDRAAEEILQQYIQPGDLEIDVSGIPDLVPALAAAAAFRTGGRTAFIHAARLRLKESDRIRTTCRMVEALGARTEEWEDGFAVNGDGKLPGGGIVDCCNDHRIAMSAAVAAACCDNSVTLLGTECVAKSYPRFWEDFTYLGGKTVDK